MLVPNRHQSSDSYRYGFNGKENDNEVKGEGNFQDYGMRMYNPRIGRFFNVDPLTNEYPELTPFQFASNTPIQAIDIDGLEGGYYMNVPADQQWQAIQATNRTYAKVAAPLLETIAGFVPYIGQSIDAKDTYEAYNGGTGWDKVFATAAWIPGLDLFKGARKLIKGGNNLVDGTKSLYKLEKAAAKIDNLLQSNKSLKASFKNGKYDLAEATEDITVYRVSGGNSKKGTGSFFTPVKPESSAQAEEMLNINAYGNTGTEVTPVTIKKGTQFAIGEVAGGTGAQIFIPKDLQKAEGNNIIRHYSKTETLE